MDVQSMEDVMSKENVKVKPVYIVIDGPDAVSKGTVISGIEKSWPKGRKLRRYFDPGISNDARHGAWMTMRQIVKTTTMSADAETLLFFAMRAELMSEVDLTMKEGYDVIQDRGTASTEIYQGLIKGRLDLIKRLETCVKFATPDIHIILNAPFDVLTERLKKRLQNDNKSIANMDKFKANEDFRRKVFAGYQQYIHVHHREITVVDANDTEENVLKNVMEVITKWMPNNS